MDFAQSIRKLQKGDEDSSLPVGQFLARLRFIDSSANQAA